MKLAQAVEKRLKELRAQIEVDEREMEILKMSIGEQKHITIKPHLHNAFRQRTIRGRAREIARFKVEKTNNPYYLLVTREA